MSLLTNLIRNKLSVVIILLMTVFFVQDIYATGGYFRHGYGVKYSALAGAGTALSLSSIGVTSNPAGLAYLDTRYDFNLGLFSPSRQYTITGNPSGYEGTFGLTPGTIESESNYFPMPTMGANWKLNETSSLGVVIFANGGMNTDYPTATFYDPTSPGTGVNLSQAFLGATYSIQFVENHAIGVTALVGYQMFAAKGLLSFANFSSDPAALTGNRMSTSAGFGARIGYMGKILPELAVGASYQTRMWMSEFEEYKGLFAEQGDFDVPSSWNVGVAVNPTHGWTFALDLQQIRYSEIASINNPLVPMELAPAFPDGQGGFVPNPNYKPLGSDNGAGFGWDDIFVVKFGVMYEAPMDWTLMAGYSYGQQPFDEGQVLFNILAPGIIQHHVTFGFSKVVNNNHEINVAFMYAPTGEVVGPNPLEAPNQQTIGLEMSQWQLEIGYAFR